MKRIVVNKQLQYTYCPMSQEVSKNLFHQNKSIIIIIKTNQKMKFGQLI